MGTLWEGDGKAITARWECSENAVEMQLERSKNAIGISVGTLWELNGNSVIVASM